MPLHLTFDGGGSKLSAVVYDDSFNVVARRESGGTNARFLGAERVAAHCETALGGALDDAYAKLGEYPADACGVSVGPTAPLTAVIASRAPGCAVTFIGEAYACRLAGALDTDGCVVIAGTGSGVAWIRGDTVLHRGGYGPELGDEGSGYFIGQRGIRAAVAAIDGWGEPTTLTYALARYTGANYPTGEDCPTSADAALRYEGLRRALYAAFYNDTDPIPRHTRIAGFTPSVGVACDSGDRVASAIIAEAGELLARQAAAMYILCGIPRDKSIVLCGGVWHSTGALGNAFRAVFAASCGGAFAATPVSGALLPPYAAGAVWRSFERGTLAADRAQLLETFGVKR